MLNKKPYRHFRTIIKRIRDVGIPVKIMTDSQMPDNTVLLSLDDSRKKLQFTLPEDKDDYQERQALIQSLQSVQMKVASVSKKHSQLVLVVKERKSKFTFPVRVDWDRSGEPPRYLFTNHFPINFAMSDDRVYFSVGPKEIVDGNGNNSITLWEAEVTAEVDERETCFFIGRDEGSLFISCLPCTINSLKEIDNVLMPDEVKHAVKEGRDVKRQGEFYFVPLDEDETRELMEKEKSQWLHVNYTNKVLVPMGLQKDFGPDGIDTSDHECSLGIEIDCQEQYALGIVSNPRHDDLILTSLHRVYPNLEVPAPDDTLWD